MLLSLNKCMECVFVFSWQRFYLHACCIRFTLSFTSLEDDEIAYTVVPVQIEWPCMHSQRHDIPSSKGMYIFALICTQNIVSLWQTHINECPFCALFLILHCNFPLFNARMREREFEIKNERLGNASKCSSSFQLSSYAKVFCFHSVFLFCVTKEKRMSRAYCCDWEIGKRAFKMVISHSIFYMNHITYE